MKERRQSKKRRKSEGNKMKGDMYDDGTPNPLVVKCPVCGGMKILRQESPNKVEWWCEECGECVGSVHGDPVGAPGEPGDAPAIKNIRETFSRPSTTCNKERTVPKGKAREYRRQKR